MTSRWSVFRNRDFRNFWLGYLLSQFGDAVFFITVGWMIVEITGSGLIMGTFLLLLGVPRVILMLVGGVLVDRISPRGLMFWSDILRAVVLGVMLLLPLEKGAPLWPLYVLAVIFGSVDAV